ncbi:MAG TPA: hypothetical protein VK211_14290 [Kamptonema sp.]|nr:hypothetical protein [Kamptonema sp.]
MLKFVIVSLVALELILLTALALPPANATVSKPEIYTWNFASVGSKELVCKKVILAPGNRELPPSSPMQAVNINSIVVDASYCANAAKPILKDS